MENKFYFTVQDVKKTSIGYKTYEMRILDSTRYKTEELQKAIKHYKNHKSNSIIMNRVKYLDDMPYVELTNCFGEERIECKNGEVKTYICFDKFDIRYEI